MQCAWPLPTSWSSSQTFSVRAVPVVVRVVVLGRHGVAQKDGEVLEEPRSHSLTRTEHVVCGE